MTETRKTLTYWGVAIVLVVFAVLMVPTRVTPNAFLDRGESFFPDFTDPNTAHTLEVIEFDAETGVAKPFKVTFKDGQWSIPSHHDYPADGKERLAKTAAGLIGIVKNDFRSNNVGDHESCSVVDPLDETVTTLKGRGKRVTIKGASNQVLADLIVGTNVEGRESMSFVRLPGQKRVYVTRMDMEISSNFEDWIERDLLQLEKDDIERVVLKDYSINEQTGRINQRDVLTLDKRGTWKANRMSPTQEVDSTQIASLLRAIDELSIVGVRPKPSGLSRTLSRSKEGASISQTDILSLQSKGYYFARDGRLLSNEGELQILTNAGVVYTLRFGEVVYGKGEKVTAGAQSSGDQKNGSGENRYLFITISFDPRKFSEPRRPGNTDFLDKPEEEWTVADKGNKELKRKHDEWKKNVEGGQSLSDELDTRFADWYYVISADSFEKLNRKRSDLVKRKKELA